MENKISLFKFMAKKVQNKPMRCLLLVILFNEWRSYSGKSMAVR